MNCSTQNEKIEMINEETLVIGIDVGSLKHYARAFTCRKVELTKKAYPFDNDEEGFNGFLEWAAKLKQEYGKTKIVCGMEPTGHYWINLAIFLMQNDMTVVHVNPSHVKKSKELDDTNPSKNDRKDPKTIAGLVVEGRYACPYIPEGKYAELRELTILRAQAVKEMTRLKNRQARWFNQNFPEFPSLYSDMKAVSAKLLLKEAPLPQDIVALGVDGVVQIWRNAKLKAVGKKKAEEIVEAAKHSIGRRQCGKAARSEIKYLLEDMERYSDRIKDLEFEIEETLRQIPNTDKVLEVKGLGLITVATIIAEAGDMSRLRNAKCLQKLAGLSIVSNDSGKHKGESRISYRGRKRLRLGVYQAAMSLVCHNDEFAAIHRHFTTRANNQLKKMQSLMAIGCKLLRIVFVIMTKGVEYDGAKMMQDIIRPEKEALAA